MAGWEIPGVCQWLMRELQTIGCPQRFIMIFLSNKWLLLGKKALSFSDTHTHIIIISPLWLVQFPMFVGRISPVSEVPKYDIKSVTYPNYIPSNLVYFVDYICNIIYICRILYTYIFGLFQKTSLKWRYFWKFHILSMSRESYIL